MINLVAAALTDLGTFGKDVPEVTAQRLAESRLALGQVLTGKTQAMSFAR